MEMITSAGKVGQVEVDSKSALYKFSWVSGGEVPLIMTGLFTSQGEVFKAWNRYQASQVKKNGSSAS